jgi:hypothetical protein
LTKEEINYVVSFYLYEMTNHVFSIYNNDKQCSNIPGFLPSFNLFGLKLFSYGQVSTDAI